MRMFVSCLMGALALAGSAHAQFLQSSQKIVGTGGVGQTEFGTAVAMSSDGRAIVIGGAVDANRRGAAWTFTTPIRQIGAKLVGTGSTASAQGDSVAISGGGNTVIVSGSYGGDAGTWFYHRPDTLSLLTPQSGRLDLGGAPALSADGNLALISAAPGTLVYARTGGVWAKQNALVSDACGPSSSTSLSADGNTALVSSNSAGDTTGGVCIFVRKDGVWKQQGARLVGSGAVPRSYQGTALALSADGNTAMVGGYGDNGTAGAVWVFARSGDAWTQQGDKITAPGGDGQGWFGYSVALSADGNTAVIGAPQVQRQGSRGSAWSFVRIGGVWKQQSQLVPDTMTVTGLGTAVALSADGSIAMVTNPNDGTLTGGAWQFMQYGTIGTLIARSPKVESPGVFYIHYESLPQQPDTQIFQCGNYGPAQLAPYLGKTVYATGVRLAPERGGGLCVTSLYVPG